MYCKPQVFFRWVNFDGKKNIPSNDVSMAAAKVQMTCCLQIWSKGFDDLLIVVQSNHTFEFQCSTYLRYLKFNKLIFVFGKLPSFQLIASVFFFSDFQGVKALVLASETGQVRKARL